MKFVLTLFAALSVNYLSGASVQLADHGGALSNPGMGWVCYYYSDLPHIYGSKLASTDTLQWFEGCSTVYLRLPWSLIEPEEGKFQWSIIDTPAQRWIQNGKKIALRFTTSENWMEYATPKWVENAGAKTVRYNMTKGPDKNGELVDPVFDDPVYLKKLENFLSAAAKRYDGNPNVAFLDIGSFGLWGEGHTIISQKLPDKENLRLAKIHIDLTLKHFSKTLLAISDDVIGPFSKEEDFLLMQYCRSHGITLRDDSIMVFKDMPWNRTALAGKFWRKSPVIIEHQHYDHALRDKSWFSSGLIDSVEEYHASYMSIHSWPRQFWEKEKETIRKVNRRLGYRFVTPEIVYPDTIKPGKEFKIHYKTANVGVAPCYFDACFTFTLLDAQGGIAAVLVDSSRNVKDFPVAPIGKTVWNDCTANLILHKTAPKIAPGKYKLCISLGQFDGTPVIGLPYPSDSGKRVELGTVSVL